MQRYTEALPAASQGVNAKQRAALERTAAQRVDSGAELHITCVGVPSLPGRNRSKSARAQLKRPLEAKARSSLQMLLDSRRGRDLKPVGRRRQRFLRRRYKCEFSSSSGRRRETSCIREACELESQEICPETIDMWANALVESYGRGLGSQEEK